MRNSHQEAYQALLNIPARTPGLSIYVVFGTGITLFLIPQRIPRHSRMVLRASSSWGPAHSSEDVFRLSTNAQRSHWILWHGYYDDNEQRRWIYQPVAICKYGRVLPRTAAFYMLVELLQMSPCFDKILNWIGEGILAKSEVHLARAIAKAKIN